MQAGENDVPRVLMQCSIFLNHLTEVLVTPLLSARSIDLHLTLGLLQRNLMRTTRYQESIESIESIVSIDSPCSTQRQGRAQQR